MRLLEEQIDDVASTKALLTAALIDARRERGIAGCAGQPIFRKLAEVDAGITKVRGDTVDVHRLTEAMCKRMNISMDDFGDNRPKDSG